MRIPFSIFLGCLVAVAGTACEAPTQHTGKRPVAARSEPGERERSSVEERIAARQAAAARGEREGRDVAADEEIIGVGSSGRYHLPDCRELGTVPQTDRVLFVSAYDALDGAYHPCPVCRPGP